jgi:predicted MPP superfamily phosphohydrolase
MPTQALFLLLPWLLAALLCTLLLLFVLIAPLWRRDKGHWSQNPWVKYGARTVAVFGILSCLYALNIEPFWIETRTVFVESSKLRAPLRIVLLSDLHAEGDGLVAELCERIAPQKPDLIFIAGDFLDAPEGKPELQQAITCLATLAPLYGVLGNHDRSNTDLVGLPITLLDGDVLSLTTNGNQLLLGGSAFWGREEYRALQTLSRQEGFRIFLHHAPDRVEEAHAAQVDLYLAGHTHGGQIALPGYGALITFSTSGKRFEQGLHKLGDTNVFVSRGIGTTFFRARFGARPEISVIELRPSL